MESFHVFNFESESFADIYYFAILLAFSNTMITAILFDLDGTLLDRETSLKQFISTQYNRLPALRHISKDNYISRFLELDCHGYVWKDKVYQSLVSEFSIDTLSWQDLLQDYENEFLHSCIPFPNLHSTLITLKTQQYLLGIVTNGLGTFQRRTVQALYKSNLSG